MLQKIREYYKSKLENHPKKIFGILLAFGIIVSTILYHLPEWLSTTIVVLMQIALATYVVTSNYKENKREKMIERKKNLMLRKKWRRYIDGVEEVYKNPKVKKKLEANWLKTFEELVNEKAKINRVLDEEFINDFELASCLIFALAWRNTDESNIIYALESVENLVSNPKAYIYCFTSNDGVKLKLKEHLQTADIGLVSQVCTSKETILAVRRYLNNRNTGGIGALSNFLYELYLKCE